MAVLFVSCGFAFGQGFDFEIIQGNFTWQEAKADAEARGGRLAVLNTQEQIDAAKTYLDTLSTENIGEAWIGLTNNGSITNQSNEYVWVTGEALTASNWHPGTPNTGAATAAKLMRWDSGSVYGWDDDFVYLRRNYLLETVSPFQIIEGNFTWQEAKADAEARGGRLAVLNTQAKIDAANAFLRPDDPRVWIGLTDEAQEGQWKWITGEPLTVSNWDEGEPNNLVEEDHALILPGSRRWNDGHDFDPEYYLLEITEPVSEKGLRLSQNPVGSYARLEQEIFIELGKRYKTIIEIDGEYEKRSTDHLPHLCPGCFDFNFDSYTVEFDGSITTIEGVFISDKNGTYNLSMALWSVPELKFRKVELIDLTTQQNLISNSNFAEGLQGWKAGGGTIELYDLDGPVSYTLSEGASPNGSVTGYGKFESGSEVTLTATPNLGYRFTGWTGSVNGSQNPLSVTMNQDLTVGASFTQDTRDTDGDGLTNYQELITYNSNPNSSDSDNDGIADGVEIDAGLDINTPESIANAVAFLVAERNKRPTPEAYNSVIAERDARPTQQAYNTVVTQRDERPTFEQLTDSRLGSVILVADTETNKVKLRFCIEESDQLGQWFTREEEAEVDIPLVPGKKFFRFSVKED